MKKTTNQNTSCKGLFSVAYDIKDKQIKEVIKKYKKENPNDKRSSEQLRPFAINTIIKDKNQTIINGDGVYVFKLKGENE